jgi:HEAT repeat protein
MHRLPTLLLLCLAAGRVSADEVDLTPYLLPNRDDEWLKRSKVATDPAGLLKFLKSCQGPETPPAEVAALVAKLVAGDADAAKKLADIGPLALPALRAHMTDPDVTVVKRVRSCIEVIERDGDKPLARPAIRRLVERKVPGAAEALLGYVPFAGDPAAEEDVWYGLDELADRDPKVLGVLEKALKDAQPARRAVAACILGRRGSPAQKAAVRGLLEDPDPTVRLRSAQGLLAGRDTAGLLALSELLRWGPVEVRLQAEELLRWVAGDTTPPLPYQVGDEKGAVVLWAYWTGWSRQFGETVDVAAREKEPNRPLLVLAIDREKGLAWLVGSDGTTRWAWPGLKQLADAHYVPGGTLLALQGQPVREKPLLSERTVNRTVLWTHDDMRDPASCQRLSNGQVFVAERQDIVRPYLWYQVFAPGDGIVATRPEKLSGTGSAVAMRRTADGKIVCARINQPAGVPPRLSGLYEYDPSTDRAREIPISNVPGVSGRPIATEIDRGGHLISGLSPTNLLDPSILEIDSDGYVTWEYRLAGVSAADRLPDKTVLAGLGDRLIEVSRDKRMVGEIVTDRTVQGLHVCLRLCRFGFEAGRDVNLDTAVEFRLRQLEHRDLRVRLNACRRLSEMGPRVAGHLPRLKELQTTIAKLTDTPLYLQELQKSFAPKLKDAFAQLLLDAGAEAIPKLLAEAKHADGLTRAKAVSDLGAYSRAPGVLDAVLEAFNDNDPQVRAAAAATLGGTEANPHRAIPHWKVLGRMRWAADRVVPALMKAAEDKEPRVRAYAIIALGQMGVEGKPAVSLLVRRLNDEDKLCRAQAAISLGKIGTPPDQVVPPLIAALDDKSFPDMQGAAAIGLGIAGAQIDRSIDHLMETYHHRIDEKQEKAAILTRMKIVEALGRLPDSKGKAVSFLIGVLKDKSVPDEIRYECALALAQKGAAAVDSLPILHDIVKTEKGFRGKEAVLRSARAIASACQDLNDK